MLRGLESEAKGEWVVERKEKRIGGRNRELISIS